MRLDIDHDSGPALPNVHFSETKDSGVGRSPRDPGPGSGLRSLGESSVPPAWLQDVSFHLLLPSLETPVVFLLRVISFRNKICAMM